MAADSHPSAPTGARRAGPCASCGAALDAQQRYCVRCGTRCVAAPEDLLRALGIPPQRPSSAGPSAPAPAAARVPRLGLALAATTLVVGLLVGAAAGPGPAPSPAAVAQRIIAIDEPAPSPAAPAPAAPTATRAAPPHAVSKATTAATPSPAPVDSTPAPAATPAPAPSPAPSPSPAPKPAPTPAPATPPSIAHVWVISLGPIDLGPAFTAGSQAPYLSDWLAAKGTILGGYTPLAGEPASAIALLSGQAPNAATSSGCATYGGDCLYPPDVRTLADQVTAAGGTWRAYVEGVGTPCRHPETGAPDPWTAPTPADAYLTARNPFVYFASLLDAGACAAGDVGIDGLGADLADPARTPTLSWIVPSVCHDGRALECEPGQPTGLAAANLFLRHVVPAIRTTAAFKDGGLILVLPSAASPAPAPAPAVPTSGLVLSPHVRGGERTATPLGPYAVLRTLEDVLGVTPLGHAGDDPSPLDDLLHTTNPPTTGRSA